MATNRYKRALHAGLVIGLAFVMAAALPTAAVAQEPLHARISYADSGMVKGKEDADWSYATINTLVMPNDALWVDKEGTLELEMSGGSFLRMADGTKAEIASLPPTGYIRGQTGSFYVQRVSRSSGDIQFETPVCKTNVEADSQVRFDVLSNGATTITVRWGSATVRSEGGGDVVVGQGQRSYVDPGYLPSEPAPFDLSVEDDFDMWNRERGRLLAVGSEAVPAAVRVASAPIGVADLTPYGEWVSIDNGYWWRPTAVVDFVPYRAGHWSFFPACGYTWVDDYPFGYVTTHYGRWWHHNSYGWVWGYRDTWGPAWVASVRYGPNFVWCPLDPWDSPYVSTSDYFVVGGLQFGIYASTYCLADDLLIGHYYGHPCTAAIFHGVPAAEINIWNINIGGGHGHHVRYTDTTLQARDYSPRRMIRGPDVFGPGKQEAHTRVATLEREMPAVHERHATGSSRTVARTSAETSTRAARARNVRVEPTALSNVRDLNSRAASVSRDSASHSLRNAGSTTLPPKSEVGRTRVEASKPAPMRSRAVETLRSSEPPQATSRTTHAPDVTQPSARTRSVSRSEVAPPKASATTHTAPPTRSISSVPQTGRSRTEIRHSAPPTIQAPSSEPPRATRSRSIAPPSFPSAAPSRTPDTVHSAPQIAPPPSRMTRREPVQAKAEPPAPMRQRQSAPAAQSAPQIQAPQAPAPVTRSLRAPDPRPSEPSRDVQRDHGRRSVR